MSQNLLDHLVLYYRYLVCVRHSFSVFLFLNFFFFCCLFHILIFHLFQFIFFLLSCSVFLLCLYVFSIFLHLSPSLSFFIPLDFILQKPGLSTPLLYVSSIWDKSGVVKHNRTNNRCKDIDRGLAPTTCPILSLVNLSLCILIG